MGTVIAIIQARMSSTRLPGKVLCDLRGRPMLAYLLEGLSQCSRLDALVVATSTHKMDDSLASFCAQNSVRCIRGPLEDVAERFALAVRELRCEAFVRVCGDSPILDHRLVDQAVAVYEHSRPDMVTNVFPRSFPKGLSVEVLRATTFLRAAENMGTPEQREHVTRYFYEHPEQYTMINLDSGQSCQDLQMSVDTAEDLARISNLLERLPRPHWDYTWQELAAQLDGTRRGWSC